MFLNDDPDAAKSVGRKFRPDVWNNVKDQYMGMGFTAKFQQLSRQTLKDTGADTLVERQVHMISS